MVPESALEGEVGDHVQRFPSSTKLDCIVYSRRGEKGKGKVINDFRACSSGLLGCGGGDAGVEVPLGQDQGDELNGLDTSHCQRWLWKVLSRSLTALFFSAKGWDWLLKVKKWSCCPFWPQLIL